MTRDEINALRPGSKHYMAYVGWPAKFEQIGKMQFSLLRAAGMTPESKVLDIGCGSLRAGMHIIPFLGTGNYYGIEPHQWLIDEGINNLFEPGVIDEKRPSFSNNDNFDLSVFNTKFDFIIAQSIFSHTPAAQIKTCIDSAHKVLNPGGICLATFVLGKDNYKGSEWVYPSCVRYTESYIHNLIQRSGFISHRIAWPQGAKQTWFAMSDHQLDDEFINAVAGDDDMKTIVVLGMHRSATNLVAKGLNNEIYMGDNLLKPRPCNPKGFFEERSFVKLNDRILAAAGGSWDRPPALESILAQRGRFDAEIKDIVTTSVRKAKNRGFEFWGWKDPRTVLTIELFLPYLPNPHFAVCYRNPKDVAKSLKARDPKMSLEFGIKLAKIYNERIREFLDRWLKYE